MIAALYVQTGGIYFGLPDVDPWDEHRNAMLYDGPWPVVAHPPCTRWCMLAPGIETRFGYKVGDDGGTFASALAAVRKFGGVLEHPAHSIAWSAHDLPVPTQASGWTTSFLDGGATTYVEQKRYGHFVRKATWLYAYGVDLVPLRWGRDNAMGEFAWGSYLYEPEDSPRRGRKRMSARIQNHTPIEFRDELIAIATTAHALVPA